MAAIRSCSSSLVQPLSSAWRCARTNAGAAASPDELRDLHWLPAPVPGTFALAFRNAGLWDGIGPLELDDDDVWYHTRFSGGGEELLRFEGLATIAEVWLNGKPILQSDNMFLPRRILVRTGDDNDLHICFRSLTAWLRMQRGRARWRPRLVAPSSLRFARTTLLGHMPGWCPTVHPVGPWRPVLREWRQGPFAVEAVNVKTAVFDGDGRMVVRAVLDRPVAAEAVAEVAGHAAVLTQTGPCAYEGAVSVPDVALWWPHTHGVPRTHPAVLRVDDVSCELGPVGFRTVRLAADGPDDFALAVNGTGVFCRGACWTTPDIVALPGDSESYRPRLTQARDAGMNMIRIGGTMLYESEAFYQLCDELGLLVWQDAMLANFDYPASEAFRASLAAELGDFLHRTEMNASLAVFCGGSEVLQQAAMFGLAPRQVDTGLYDSFVAGLVHAQRPDLVYVPNSPSGGAWPFQPDCGVAHYYGVGAYLRSPENARRANVKFASECLALANVPDNETTSGLAVATTTDPRWKRAVPRDPGAGWDFEDVRDHYLASLFRVDPVQLRWADFPRYLDLSRAVSCILMEQVFSEWRRVGSTCAGGLVWQLHDLAPGAGWGVVDANGRPKPAWYALRRVFRPRHVVITDEGLNGLHIHVLNETGQTLQGRLRLACLRDGVHVAHEAEQPVTIAPRGARRFRSSELFPGFFDIAYAYRFGPPAHDVTIATLLDAETDGVITEGVHFPAAGSASYLLPTRDIGLEVTVEGSVNHWALRLRSRGFAQFLRIDDACFRPEDNWFHLPPGRERVVALRDPRPTADVPRGAVSGLNSDRVVRYAGQA